MALEDLRSEEHTSEQKEQDKKLYEKESDE